MFMKYLNTPDYFNIQLFDKEYYRSTKKVIYKIYLLKNSEISQKDKMNKYFLNKNA